MKARFCLVSVLIFSLLAPPAQALSPASRIAAAPHLILDLKKYAVSQAEEEAVWKVTQRRTGDSWLLRFPFPVPLPDADDAVAAVPIPTEVGLKLDLGYQEPAKPVWVPVAGDPDHFLEVEWKMAIYKKEALTHLGKMELSQFFEPLGPADKNPFSRFLDEKGILLKGGLWGLPVKMRGNGRKPFLLLYSAKPSKEKLAGKKVPFPDEIGCLAEGKGEIPQLATTPLTPLPRLAEKIAAEEKELVALNGGPQKGRRSALVRLMNGLLAIGRQWQIEVMYLDRHKASLLQMKKEPPDREKDKVLVKKHYLIYEIACALQKQIFELEFKEFQNQFRHNGTPVVRNNFGDEIAYRAIGNEKSEFPPIVYFPDWNGADADPFLQALENSPVGAALLGRYCFFVVTPLGRPHRVGKESSPLESSRVASAENYLNRASQAFRLILLAEGKKSGFAAGRGLGGLVAQEAALRYREKAVTENGETIAKPVEGLILFDPVVASTWEGPDRDFAELFPRLAQLPWVGPTLREKGNRFLNETELGRLPRKWRGWKRLVADEIKIQWVYRRGRLKPDEYAAKDHIQAALRRISRENVAGRLAAAARLPFLGFFRSRSAETAQVRRAVGEDKIFPHANLPPIELALLRRFLEQNRNGQTPLDLASAAVASSL